MFLNANFQPRKYFWTRTSGHENIFGREFLAAKISLDTNFSPGNSRNETFLGTFVFAKKQSVSQMIDLVMTIKTHTKSSKSELSSRGKRPFKVSTFLIRNDQSLADLTDFF